MRQSHVGLIGLLILVALFTHRSAIALQIESEEYTEGKSYFKWSFVVTDPAPGKRGPGLKQKYWFNAFETTNKEGAAYMESAHKHLEGPHPLQDGSGGVDVNPAPFVLFFPPFPFPKVDNNDFKRVTDDKSEVHQHNPEPNHKDNYAIHARSDPKTMKQQLLFTGVHIGDPDAKTVSNGTKAQGAARVGSSKSSSMTYNPSVGILSFSDTIIDFENLVGDESFDPVFASDPLYGATIHLDDFTLDRLDGTGIRFKGGSMTISKSGRIFWIADIPELLIDDVALTLFGVNVFGALQTTLFDIPFDLSDSPFMERYLMAQESNPSFVRELFGRTATPITDLIREGQSFTTTVQGFGPGHSVPVPEPSSGEILVLGLTWISLLRRKRKNCRN